jgi:hypothetical protein|tara:strand:- start:1266 stop:1493 length:228 start_codon:yes stop_codon:yes gene_type:complete
MIINIDKNVFIVIIAQILLAIALFYKKPTQLFNSDGSSKSYGTGKDQTLYHVLLVILIPSIILYVFLVTKNNEYV